MNKFKISLSNGESHVIHTNKNLIEVIEFYTRDNLTKIYQDGKISEVIFRQHIVKIQEVL